ncbi:MAG TPA: hypothetical protein VHL09_14770 [Dehalococcoidia bacterium]|nr:hypothetical protein [Dehalococcoidia bacterium]
MAASMSPKEAWDKYVGADVTVADFLAKIEHSTPPRGEGLPQAIGRYLQGAPSGQLGDATERDEAVRLIAEYISQTDQPTA